MSAGRRSEPNDPAFWIQAGRDILSSGIGTIRVLLDDKTKAREVAELAAALEEVAELAECGSLNKNQVERLRFNVNRAVMIECEIMELELSPQSRGEA